MPPEPDGTGAKPPDPRLEPYRFTPATVDFALERSAGAGSLLLLCCPSVAAALDARNDPRPRRLLDLDPRHAGISGFRRADLEAIAANEFDIEPFEMMIFDPPALRFGPDRVAALLARLVTPGRRLLLAYPDPFVPRIAGALAPRLLLRLDRRPEYLDPNPFNAAFSFLEAA